MKLVLFERAGSISVGVLSADGVVAVENSRIGVETPQEMMEAVIDDFETLQLHRIASGEPAVPIDAVRLLAPLPEPGKILCRVANFGADGERPSRQLYLKNPDAVVGFGDTLPLPGEHGEFILERELGAVIRHGSAFGYTCFLDVTRPPFDEWGVSWQKSFDTACAIGPCIVTADEVALPGVDVTRLVQFASQVMTLRTGDLVACGARPDQVGPVRSGEGAEMEIEGIGRLAVELQ